MKRLISFVMGCLLLTSLAFAVENDLETGAPISIRDVRPDFNVSRTSMQNRLDAGSCLLGLDDLANNWFYWPATRSPGYAIWVDPANNPMNAGCSTPFYPYHVSGLYIPFALINQEAVGKTLTAKFSIFCPKSDATTSHSSVCTGPGQAICERTETYTFVQGDYDDLAYLDIFMNCCVDGPFFFGMEIISYDGNGMNIGPLSDDVYHPDAAGQRCTSWLKYRRTNSDVTNFRDPCWLEMVTAFAGAVGPLEIYAYGEAGVACEPIHCNPVCNNHRAGDSDDNPLPVVTGNGVWDQVINLCDFCPDYNQEVDDQIPAGSFTSPGEDAVLALNFYDFNPDAPEACFTITITPTEECATKLFRLRSWLNDAIGTVADGTPRFPSYYPIVTPYSQTYNFTGASCLSNDNYRLYLDTRGCCCPVRVTITTDLTLPVSLTGFTAVGSDSRVDLHWTTAQETNIASYNIMRNNEKIGEVSGLGDAAEGHVYNFTDTQVENGRTYSYYLVAVDVNGTVTILGTTVNATPIAGAGSVVTEYRLAQNYPNPFNPNTNISYSVKEAGHVSLKVYTIDGREVATLVNQNQDANNYSVDFNARGLASGVYLYQLSVNGFSATEKMILMK